MSLTPEIRRELGELLGMLRDGRLDEGRLARLDALVADDPDARRLYINYVDLCASLHWTRREKCDGGGISYDNTSGENENIATNGLEFGVLEANESPLAVSGFARLEAGNIVGADIESQFPSLSPLPPLPTTHYPPSTDFVGGPVFSYMVASIVLCVMLLSAWAYKITHDADHIVGPPQSPNYIHDSEFVSVGQVTGMRDCAWKDGNTATIIGASVPLGRKYSLSAGLMEITYQSGAVVIIEGPCIYEVESRAGGYLSLGKLTAKVEKESSKLKAQGSRLKAQSSALFSVTTPTAVVTDLGTEFGVEVSGKGDTTSHVFRGSVEVRAVGESLPFPTGRGAGGEGRVVQLWAGESALVEKGDGANGPRLVVGGKVGNPPKFVRRLHEPPKVLDLLDIVAGGYGTGTRRERGIDPSTGRVDPVYMTEQHVSDGRYRPASWHRFIDGVFVPDVRAGAVQLDSAGHVFNRFPTNTNGTSHGSIWARAAEVKPLRNYVYWIYTMEHGERFMPDRRGLLGLHPKVGITFDLAAIRRVYPDVVPGRFSAVAGLADSRPPWPSIIMMADFRVFVDGRLKLERTGLRPQDEPVPVDVELGPDERFLTLVATEGGDKDDGYDWFVLGDPVLLMEETGDEGRGSGKSEVERQHGGQMMNAEPLSTNH